MNHTVSQSQRNLNLIDGPWNLTFLVRVESFLCPCNQRNLGGSTAENRFESSSWAICVIGTISERQRLLCVTRKHGSDDIECIIFVISLYLKHSMVLIADYIKWPILHFIGPHLLLFSFSELLRRNVNISGVTYFLIFQLHVCYVNIKVKWKKPYLCFFYVIK